MTPTIPAPQAPTTRPLADGYRLPSDPYALEVLVAGRAELDRVGPNAWRHRRADGRVVTICVPSR